MRPCPARISTICFLDPPHFLSARVSEYEKSYGRLSRNSCVNLHDYGFLVPLFSLDLLEFSTQVNNESLALSRTQLLNFFESWTIAKNLHLVKYPIDRAYSAASTEYEGLLVLSYRATLTPARRALSY